MPQYEPVITDEELLAGFRIPGQQEKFFAILIRQYQKQIYWFIRRMVLDHDDANDLTQDVFIRVWENLDRFRGDSHLIYWIYRIATNTTFTFLRVKKRKRAERIDEESPLARKLKAGLTIDADQVQEKLLTAINTLPDRQRAVFQLRYYDEMPYGEMAKMLSLTEGSLKATYFHAVKKIEKFMTEKD